LPGIAGGNWENQFSKKICKTGIDFNSLPNYTSK
jgi:hypothetical protein